MAKSSGSTGSRRIPASSLLAVQFDTFKIRQVKKETQKDEGFYRLITSGKTLDSTWFTDRPKRLTGQFRFEDVASKDSWKGLYGNDNPNSSLSGDGRTIVFETGFFKKRANGGYVSKIKPNTVYRDEITGKWAKASLVIDATQSELDFDNYFDNTAGGNGILSILTGGYPDITSSCSERGVGFNPVFIANTTDQTQYVNFTINEELGNNLTIIGASEISGYEAAATSSTVQCGGGYGLDTGTSKILSIPPNTTWSGGMISGGADGPHTGMTGTENRLGIGGGQDSGHWYDLPFSVSGLYNNYQEWGVEYQGTGGTTAEGSNQFGFVVVQTSPTTGSSGTQFTVTNTVLTPYSGSLSYGSGGSGYNGAVQWLNNDAMAFAFI